MRIESGTTGERRTRVAIFFLMCAAFTVWFGYDGWRKYPSENLRWALQAMPEKPPSPSVHPHVSVDNLNKLTQRSAEGARITTDELRSLLGEPLYEQPRELTFVGSGMTAMVRVSDGKVLSAATQPVSDADKPTLPNYRVRTESVQAVKPGITEAEVTAALGQPTRTQEKMLWFVGPAAYAKVQIEGDRVLGKPAVFKATDHSEGDIFTQKLLAGALLITTLFIAAKLLSIARTHVVLDDAGLNLNGRQIPFDEMTGLDTAEYADKGWVDLKYRRGGREDWVRLDSYHIDRFRDIVRGICERKGFTPPNFAPRPDAPAAQS